MVRFEMRLRSTRLSMGALNTVLVVAPHPDDESFGCGGTLAQLAKKGASLHIAFITDGRASHPFHPVLTPKEIAERRKEEAVCAANMLGIGAGNLTFMDAPDGELTMLEREDPRNIVEEIALLLGRVEPDAVLLPCRSDGSSEHDAAFRLVQRAVEKSGTHPRIVEFPIWSWWNPLLLLRTNFGYKNVWRVELGDALPLKARAIATYRSQTFPIPPDTAPALPPGFASMFQGLDEFFLEK
jgi:LmbE family N-acetylglucosaminyl deacetylase